MQAANFQIHLRNGGCFEDLLYYHHYYYYCYFAISQHLRLAAIGIGPFFLLDFLKKYDLFV